MSLLRVAVGIWKHIRLYSKRHYLDVDRSARLYRKFNVRFLVTPENRFYLTVGKHCMLNVDIVFESTRGNVEIGDRVYIGAGTKIISRSRVTIGDDVTVAWGVTIYDHNSHSLDWQQRARMVEHFYRTYGTSRCYKELDWSGVSASPVVVKNKVWIGFDAVILKGVTIGEGAVIGARSVVTRDVEPYSVVAGNPAVLVRRLDSR